MVFVDLEMAYSYTISREL